MNMQRPWHEYEHNFQIMYKVGMGHKPPIPEKLSTEGKDFLGHCLESEPKRRWTASMLLDHPFVKVTQIKTYYSASVPPQAPLWSLNSCVLCFRFVQMKSEQNLVCCFSIYKLKHYCKLCQQRKGGERRLTAEDTRT